jgi:hypothetical protein
MQIIGFAAITPAFLALHLWTSPTATNPTVENLWVDPNQLAALPISVVVGLFLPSLAMALPAPSIVTIAQKQALAAFWQAFPLWIYVVQQVVVTLVALISPTDSKSTALEKNDAALEGLRLAYMFGVSCSAWGHIGTWSISLIAMLFPQLFALGVAEVLHPKNVFLNALPWSGAKAANIAEGMKWLLQWDLLIGSVVMLLWAIAVRVRVETPRSSLLAYVSQLALLLTVSLIIGPSGAAVMAVWTRDELVFGRRVKGKTL